MPRQGQIKKKYIAEIPMSVLTWNDKHSIAFADLQVQLQEATRLTHRDTKKVFCFHTDTSAKHCAVADTQCDLLRKPLIDQEHHPLAFLRSSFTERVQNWSTYEQEAFAVVQAVSLTTYWHAIKQLLCSLTSGICCLFSTPLRLQNQLNRYRTRH